MCTEKVLPVDSSREGPGIGVESKGTFYFTYNILASYMEKLVQFSCNLINEAGGLQVTCGNFLTMCLLCVHSQAHRDSIKNKEVTSGDRFSS